MSMSPEALAALIKAKYPDYAEVDDRELVSRIVTKYPDYQSQLPAFSAEGASKLNGATPQLVQHYLNLYDQFQQAGIKPVVRAGVRTAEQEYYLYTHGYPTKGNTGYGSKISPHQEGRAIDFSFAPDQRDKGRAILAQYAKTNGLHIPSDEPWHVAVPKGEPQPISSGYERNPDPDVDWMNPLSVGRWVESRGDMETFPQTGTELPAKVSRVPSEPPTQITASDLEWHLGIPAAQAEDWFRQLPERKRTEVYQSVAKAVTKDEAKKAAGITLTPSAKYQSDMRRVLRVAIPAQITSTQVPTEPARPLAFMSAQTDRPFGGNPLIPVNRTQATAEDQAWKQAARQQLFAEYNAERTKIRHPESGEVRPPEITPSQIPDAAVQQRANELRQRSVETENAASSWIGQATQSALDWADSGFIPNVDADILRGMARAGAGTLKQIPYVVPIVGAMKLLGIDPYSDVAKKILAGADVQGKRTEPTAKINIGKVQIPVGDIARGVKEGIGSATIEIPKLLLGSELLTAAELPVALNLPIQGALSRADEGVPGVVKGAAGGFLYHYGGQFTGPYLGRAGNTLLWIGAPAAEAKIANPDLPWSQAIAQTLPMGAFAGFSGGERARVLDSDGNIRIARLRDMPAVVQGNLTLVPPPALQTTPAERLQYRHADFGIVTEAESQSGVPRGKLRVTDAQGVEHVIVKPSTVRNQRAIPIKGEEANAVETGQVPENRVGEYPRIESIGPPTEAGGRDRSIGSGQVEQAKEKALTVPEEPTISAQPTERINSPLQTSTEVPLAVKPAIPVEQAGAQPAQAETTPSPALGVSEPQPKTLTKADVSDLQAKATALSAERKGIQQQIPALETFLQGSGVASDVRTTMEKSIATHKARLAEIEPKLGVIGMKLRHAATPSLSSSEAKPSKSYVPLIEEQRRKADDQLRGMINEIAARPQSKRRVSALRQEFGNDLYNEGREYGYILEDAGHRIASISQSARKFASVEQARTEQTATEPQLRESAPPAVPAEPLASQVPEAQNILRGQAAIQAAEPIRETRLPASPTVAGAQTEISIPDSDRTYRARYVVREAEDVVPSHDSQNFQPRSDYYHVNDRQYQSEPQYQIQVIDRSRPEKFNPRAVVNNSPTVEVGPPVIDADGNVLGGNSRAMIIERVYQGNDPTARDAYRQLLIDQAKFYGIDPSEVMAMKRPVLVRELSDAHLERPEVQKIITELNRTSTTPLTAAEQSMTAAGQISDDARRFITDMIERGGEDATVSTVMNESGAEIVNKLIADGIIQPGERNVLLKDGKPTDAAKDRIEAILVSGIYRDLKQMETTPSGIRRNIERLAIPLRTVAGTEWDIGGEVQNAIDAINEARNTTGGDLDLLSRQVSMMREPYTPDEIALAKTLRLGPRKTAEKFRGYANDYSDAQSGGGLFGVPTQAESLKVHFGIDTIVRPDANPIVNETSNRIIAAAEAGNLTNLTATINSAPSEARMQIQGLASEIAKEQTSGTENPSIVGRVAEGSQEGAKVPDYDQSVAAQSGAGQVPGEPQAADVTGGSLGPGARSVNEPIPEVKERLFGKRFVEDKEIAQDIRDQIGTARYYEPIPNTVTAADATRLVEERGIPQSMAAIRDEDNGIPFHVRSAMGQIVIKKLNDLYRGLRNVEPSDAAFVLDQAVDMAEWQMDYGTRLGQGVQSFAMWARLTPDGKLLTFKRAVDKARARHEAIAGEDVKEIVQEMNKAPENVVPEQMELIEGARVVKRVIARKATAAKREGDPTIWEEYKNAIAKQLFNFANPKAKVEPPLQEFSARLLSNVEPLLRQPERINAPDDVYSKLREVVENFDKYKEAWNEAVSYIRSKYDKKPVAELAAMEQRITDLHSAFQTRAFDRVLNSAIRQAEINFSDLARAHYADRTRTKDDLIRDIQTNMGIQLSPEEATEMVARTTQTLEARIIKARERILESLATKGNKVAKKVLPISEKIVEAARLGVFNEQQFYDAASERLGLPKYDKSVAAGILELAGRIEDAPEGIPKDRTVLELNRYIAEQKGFGTEDLPLGIYYGNILSGYNTHIVNAIDTAMNVISEVNGLAMANPRAAAKIYSGLIRGLSEGSADALMALTEGRMKTEGKWMEAPRLMEIARFGEKGGVPIQTETRLGRTVKAIAETKPAVVLNAYKYVTRLLAASDTVFYQGSKEARAALLADRMARADGLTGDALNARVKDILAFNRQEDFRAQAKREGFEGSQAIVRANELRDMVRNGEIESDAVNFAGEATYNHDPHGALGYASKVISNWSQHFPALKLFVPFTRIVANVTNRGLNYTPYGFKRAFGYGKVVEGRYKLFGEPVTPEAQRLMLTRATVGTVGLTLLGGLQAAGVLTVHGAGPSDPERRRQLQQAGWRAYSIQMGDHYFSYVYTPLGLGLSVLGNMSDAERYHELEQKDIATRGAYAIARIGSTVFSQSFLSGLSRLFNALSDSPQESVTAVKQTLSSTASAMVAPNLAKDIYKLFDNKAYQSNTLMEDLVRNTPFAALVLRPQLNAFGEPVRVQRQRFLDVMTSDPAWRFVIEKGLRVPVPDRNTEIWKEHDRRITPAEYYELLQTSGPLLKQWILDHQDKPDPLHGLHVPLRAMTDDEAQDALSKAASDVRQPILNKIRVTGMVDWYEKNGASLSAGGRTESLKTLRKLQLKMVGISEKTGDIVKPLEMPGTPAEKAALRERLNKALGIIAVPER